LRNLTGANVYNVLHLKAEESWAAYCARWGSEDDGAQLPLLQELVLPSIVSGRILATFAQIALSSGVVRDNCMNNTDNVGSQLELHRFSTNVSSCRKCIDHDKCHLVALRNIVMNRLYFVCLQLPLLLLVDETQSGSDIAVAVQSLESRKSVPTCGVVWGIQQCCCTER
jgi:hypothetical protein